MKALRESLQDYLALRRGLGFKCKEPGKRLPRFVSFMEQRAAITITHKLALEWATHPGETKTSGADRLSLVRGFARYCRNFNPQTEVPPSGLIPFHGRAKPYLYSQREIRQLMATAQALPPTRGLRRWTYSTLLGLLAATGMRLGEALTLKRSDVDLQEGMLTVRSGKFGKSRLIPLHPSTRGALRRYARVRDAHLGTREGTYFLAAERGGRVWPTQVYLAFYRISRQLGLRGATASKGPRLHDLRHRFAVQTLLRWDRAGQDVERRLPQLSTYLGHVCVRDTYWYLSAHPTLMRHAAKRLQSRWEARS